MGGRMLVAVAAAAAGALALAPEAGAPPAYGGPNVGAEAGCVAYGGHIPVAGSGFAPGSPVAVSAPPGHYELPGTVPGIAAKTLTANATGGFRTSLAVQRVPREAAKYYRWSYQPRVIFASGTGQASGQPGESFASVLVASRAVCRALRAGSRRGDSNP
jgi:hypothetical protein